MSSNEYEGLDSQELLQLAVLDSAANRHDTAIVKLKRAIGLDPSNAKAHYMLGAEHAEIGLTERAIEEMTTAVGIDPKLETAQFQLGLLFYTLGRLPEATERWQSLDFLGADHALVGFKQGLLNLADNKFEDAEDALIKAKDAAAGTSLPLKADIEKVLANTRRHRAEIAGDKPPESTVESSRIGEGLAKRYGDFDA